MTRNDDFGDVGNKYPLFWVKYDDLAPFLAKQQLMTSNVNNAAVMSAEDYLPRICIRVKSTRPIICRAIPWHNTVLRIQPWRRNRNA